MMEGHVKAVAIIYIVLGCLCVLVGLGLMLFFGGLGVAATQENQDAGLALGAIGGIVFVVMLIFSVPSILAGWGLMKRKEWARILTIVLSALNLLSIPIGTVIGIYSLWVLLNKDTAPLFRAGSAVPSRI